MSIILIILFLALTIWFFIGSGNHGLDLIGGFLSVCVLIISISVLCSSVYLTKEYPVRYDMIEAKTKYIIETDYGIFDIKKDIKTSEFTPNSQGYIRVSYNIFGEEVRKHEFITK